MWTINRHNRGLTLIEVLVSVSIFGIALGAVAYILTTNLADADMLRDDSIATGLAQEGLEVVRNIRDSEWLSSNSFGNSLPNGTYRVQWNSVNLLALGTNPYLNLDNSTGIYSYDSGNASVFKRTIAISQISTNQIKVVVDVTWHTRSGDRDLTAESHLFNWY